MAPRVASQKPRENQFPFEVGVRGRKTGVTVPDTGIRDEHGLEPMDHLFSSPAKAQKAERSGKMKRAEINATLTSETDMDMGESTIPEPTEILNKRASMRMPPPRSKSPVKTFLQSPAKRHPSLGPQSSPLRGSVVSPKYARAHTPVNRRLDFSLDGNDRDASSATFISSAQNFTRPTAKLMSAVKLTNGTHLSPNVQKSRSRPSSDDGQYQEEYENLIEEYTAEDGENSYQIVQADDEDLDQQEEPEEEPEAEEVPVKQSKKRARRSIPDEAESKAILTRREKRRSSNRSIEEPIDERSEEEEAEERPAKRPRGKAASQPKKSEPKVASKKRAPAAKKSKRDRPSISSPPEVHRGPPRPKNSRGLYILRRETPKEATHTRSGRNVVKPLAYWKNETIVYGDDEEADGDRSFLVPVIKEIFRAEEVEEPQRARRKGTKSNRPKRREVASESEEEAEDLKEPWESEEGRIFAEVRGWNPDNVDDDEPRVEEEIAVSAGGVNPREVPGLTFKFNKTVTLPFFGSGCIELPPGGVKKPKNSRRMHMTFFLFSGRVVVTINDSTFRIGKGGLFNVPRGNFYSIENDYDKTARIFFSQGCEIYTPLAEG